MGRAMIVVDVQNDFCPGGSLAVEGGDEVAVGISQWLAARADHYSMIVVTADWHPAPDAAVEIGFDHFADEPDFVDTWPPHCVQGTPGAEFHPDLTLPDGTVVVRKGQAAAAYSGFEGLDEEGVPLAQLLRQADVTEVDVAGLATDYCVRATALDAVAEGLTVRLLEPLSAGVAPETTERALREMAAAGVDVVSTAAGAAG